MQKFYLLKSIFGAGTFLFLPERVFHHLHVLLVMTGLLLSSAKSRSIALPLDLEAQISSMLSTSALNSLSRSNPNYKSSSRSSRPIAPSNPWDYKNIIEKLQVHQDLPQIQLQPRNMHTSTESS